MQSRRTSVVKSPRRLSPTENTTTYEWSKPLPPPSAQAAVVEEACAPLKIRSKRTSVIATIQPPPLASPPKLPRVDPRLSDIGEEKGPRIGVVCAVEEEAVHFRRQMAQTSELPLRGCRRRTRGRVGKWIVDLVITDIGMANAATAVTALCLEDSKAQGALAAIINFGCAGAHTIDLALGDIVIGTEVVSVGSHRISVSGVEFKGFQTVVGAQNTLKLRSDEVLARAARNQAKAISFPIWPERKLAPKVIYGAVASSDCWRQTKISIETVTNKFNTLCEEMEAAAIAQVARKFHVPFLLLKDISNNELLSKENIPSYLKAAGTGGNGVGLNLNEIGRRAAILAVATINVYLDN